MFQFVVKAKEMDEELKLFGKQLAHKIRRHAIQMTNAGSSSHVGSILSSADILGVLYADFLNVDASAPDFEERDRFILSKGHAGAGVYAALAECGFFSTDLLKTHCADGGSLSGHVSHINVPGVEFSTGSLGHGLSVGAGMALASRMSQINYHVVVLMSDGECDEGSVWEAALFSAHNKLQNLIAIVDRNNLQSIDSTEKTLALEPFKDKWVSFGWDVHDVDGHNHIALYETLKHCADNKGYKPHIIIANTTKGKGVDFMENSVLWHYRSPKGDEFARALDALENGLKE